MIKIIFALKSLTLQNLFSRHSSNIWCQIAPKIMKFNLFQIHGIVPYSVARNLEMCAIQKM